MKVLVNEALLTGLWARNRVTIQEALISKFAFGPEKLPRFWVCYFDTIANFEDLVGKIMNFQHLTDKMYLLMKWQVEENQTQSLQTYKPSNPFSVCF